MTVEMLIRHYGYAALLVGTLMEGETVLLVAGFAAHRGYLDMPLIWIIASIGTFIGDQVLFVLARRKGAAILNKKKSWQPQFDKIRTRMEQHQNLILYGYRMFYGLRIVAPIAIGLSTITTRRFVLANAVTAFIWAAIIGYAGYLAGAAAEKLFGRIERLEEEIIIALLVAAVLLWIIRLIRRRRAL
jgi:membrane protein DedA with SNARE-associated domain